MGNRVNTPPLSDTDSSFKSEQDSNDLDPENDPFRRRLLLLISIAIVALSMLTMEWWSGVGIECTTTEICECYPRGIRCWFMRHL